MQQLPSLLQRHFFSALLVACCITAGIVVFVLPHSQSGNASSPAVSSLSPTLSNGEQNPPIQPRWPSLCDNATVRWDLLGYDSWIPLGGNMSLVAPTQAEALPPTPRLCVIAQTDLSQSPFSSTFSIDRFIASWLAQRLPQWNMILLDVSGFRNHSFHYLHGYIDDVVKRNGISQIQVLNASLSLPERDASSTAGNFFPLPDMIQTAKRLCPASTQKLLLANASDWYHPEFVSAVLKQPSADIVGVDFFSNDAVARRGVERSLRSCLDLSQPPCSCNPIIPSDVELGSLVLDFDKFGSLNHALLIEVVGNCSYPTESGRQWQECLLQYLLENNWNRSRLDRCLFSAAPNPHLCALYGHITAHTTPFSASDFMCVPSKDTAELLIQEDVQEFKMPFFDSSCFHASRFGSERITAPTGSDAEESKLSSNSSRSVSDLPGPTA
eukprot:TRINITY_DN1961_c0_g1_i1.p1 TRINITY_DN1961_c0_g1~~TRINITY_DN1961_c0_g1_i1.p1  ORF type:complete len:440 (+),score=32.64 TRINITY_DN1961_c0_g1_i1:96-1415(+)